MANTITNDGKVVQISAIDSDWTWTDTFPRTTEGIKIHSIAFHTAAATDVCIIKQTNASGPRLFKASGHSVETVEERVQYFHGQRLKPFLDVGDGAYNAGAVVVIVLSS